MYSELTLGDFSDGKATGEAVKRIEGGEAAADEEALNAFDRVVARVVPLVGKAMSICRHMGVPVHIAGSGPAFYSRTRLAVVPRLLRDELARFGIIARECRFASRAEVQQVREL